jgi:5-methylcytosine-specific restriction endonuclease McrA
MSRNYNDPKYKSWRQKVYERDKYTCQWPKCGKKGRLNAHHIKRWADNEALRFAVNNGITLCWKCHKKVHNKEEQYEMFFFKVLLQNGIRNGKKKK